jgi:hypothetical protein
MVIVDVSILITAQFEVEKHERKLLSFDPTYVAQNSREGEKNFDLINIKFKFLGHCYNSIAICFLCNPSHYLDYWTFSNAHQNYLY